MSSTVADVCSSSRDGGGGSGNISSGSGGGINSGDWICGDVTCHHSNFARRKQCNKCQRDRSQERSSSVGSSGSNKKKLGTEIGKAAAEKSRGLFSAEDWQCNKCANVNWARRNTCNMCNAPKFTDNEERTGFGGGYNDRGVVEYKEREESDSEYDEFGRLKKKRQHSFNQDERPEMVKTIKEKTTIDEEEDDEEDDGDDDDLAKYNLFSDDEDAIITKRDSPKNSISNTNKCDKSSMDRRSRSKNRSDVRRRQSRSSSSGGSSSSSSSNSSTSTSSSSSSSSSSSRSPGSIHKRTYSNSRSRSRSPKKPEAKRQRSPSNDRENKKRSHDIFKPSAVKTEDRRSSYTSNSRSKSRSSNHSSRSPSSKRNRSRNSKTSGKLSRSPGNSHRKRSTRSRSLTPKRRR